MACSIFMVAAVASGDDRSAGTHRTHQHRAVVLAGPRQSGKSTLARSFVSPSSPRYFDLEDPAGRLALAAPKDTLAPLHELVVIDEVQHAPELFRLLRVLIDRDNRPGQYLLLGSASPSMLRQTSESLLGRVEVIEVTPFTLAEVGVDAARRLWLRGGFPPAFTAASDDDAAVWCANAVDRFVYNDLPQFGVNVAAPTMARFWAMLAHLHGQIWNAADPAGSLGVSQPTVRRYLDWLTQACMVRQLQPWYENLGKRQVKAPKIYLRDSGLLHALLGIRSEAEFCVTRGSERRGRDLPWNTCCGSRGQTRRTSGPRTRAPSSIC
jgi:predicted AAA+ superfamily ATPase